MVEVLYCLEYRFMRKTFAAIQRHLDADAAYVPLRPGVAESWDALPAVVPDEFPTATDGDPSALDEAVRAVDPEVVVTNSRFRPEDVAFTREYPLVHVRHGSSVGRGEWETLAEFADVVDVALAPGEYWAERYGEILPDDVRTPVVGIPEADDLVGVESPRERRVLYAPTNHNYGGGSYLETAEHVLDAFADADEAHSSFELLFRPHPHDRTEEPGRTVTRRCERRIADMPNAVVDDRPTPQGSMRAADVLVSDYSGIVTEWLHTGRPLVQLTTIATDGTIPALGYHADRLSLDLLAELYEGGYPPAVERAVEERRTRLGVPMDGRAGERAAREVAACTQ